jgi:hypothetical protein
MQQKLKSKTKQSKDFKKMVADLGNDVDGVFNKAFECAIGEVPKTKAPEVRKFTTGAIRDNDSTKPDYIETVSWTAFRKFGEYMTSKKQKYGAGNFKKGIPVESYEQSLVRHLQKYLENKYEDGQQEVNEDHLSAMIFNICGILHEQGRNEKLTSKTR